MNVGILAYYYEKMMLGKTGQCIFCEEEGVLTYTINIKDQMGLPDIHIPIYQCMKHMEEECDDILEGRAKEERVDAVGKLCVEAVKRQREGISDDIKNKNPPEVKNDGKHA